MQATHNFPGEIEKIQQYFSAENSSSNVRATVAEGVDMPVYILGSSTDSAHLAAAKGLPYVFASHFAPGQLMEALRIYHNNFTPSEQLSEPYVIAAANIIAADTDEEAEKLSTSLIRMFLGILTNKRDYMDPPTEMTPELREIQANPTFQKLLRYSFIGNKETVKTQTQEFLEKTRANEIIAVSNMYHLEDRIKSFRLFSEIMNEI